MKAKVWINGKISDPEDAKVSVFDRGFLFGDGVYETGRSYGRVSVFLEEHFTRLRSSAGKLKIDLPWSDEDLKNGLFETARSLGLSDIYFRTIVTRGQISKVGLDLFTGVKPTLVHIVQELSTAHLEKVQNEGVTILTSNVVRNSSQAQDPNIKTSNYLNSLLALQDVKSRGGDDAVLCDSAGSVTEGTTFSVFGVTHDGRLITPHLSVGILDSITRRHTLQVAGDLKVEEGVFSVETFKECAETFIASSVREIVPIKKWDDRTFSQVPGKHTKRLQAALKEQLKAYEKNGAAY